MSATQQTLSRRGELLAELFLQDLEPAFVTKTAAQDVGYDFVVGFRNDKGGLNTLAVVIKTTEQNVDDVFAIQRSLYEFITNSNMPVMLLVADVKHNQLRYAIPTANDQAQKSNGRVLVSLKEIDDSGRTILRKRLSKGPRAAKLAG